MIKYSNASMYSKILNQKYAHGKPISCNLYSIYDTDDYCHSLTRIFIIIIVLL